MRGGSRALPVSALHKRLNVGGGGGVGGGGQQGGGGGQHHHQASAHDQQEQLARIVQQKRENCALVAQQQVLTKTENYFLNCFFSIFSAGTHEIAVVNFLLNVRPSTAKTKFAGKCCKKILSKFAFQKMDKFAHESSPPSDEDHIYGFTEQVSRV